jgi:hypothetical protein
VMQEIDRLQHRPRIEPVSAPARLVAPSVRTSSG